MKLDKEYWNVLVNEKIAGTNIIECVKGNNINIDRKSIKILVR